MAMKDLFVFKKGKMVFMGEFPVTFTKSEMFGTDEYRARPMDYKKIYQRGSVIKDGMYQLQACAGSGLRASLKVKGRRVCISHVSCYCLPYEDEYRYIVKGIDGKYVFIFGLPIRIGNSQRNEKHIDATGNVFWYKNGDLYKVRRADRSKEYWTNGNQIK